MSSYLLKILALLLFSLIIIISYYGLPGHSDNFTGYGLYIILIGLVYACYKGFQIFSENKKVVFTPASIFGYFLLHLFILCGLFFSLSGDPFMTGIVLFFKIIYFSILPIFIVFIMTGFGKKIFEILFGEHNDFESIFSFLISLGLGFVGFISLLSIAGFLGFYSLYSLFIILLLFLGIGYKQVWGCITGLFTYKITFDSHHSGKDSLERVNTNLLSSELFFVIISLILCVSLISIMRPFPIGWDDLGAYMNFPRLMAASGEVGFLGSMMSWGVFTGIGYLFETPVQAFFMNNVGGVLSVIVLIGVVSDILSSSNKKTFIHIPTLIAALFISMPMVVFQQAKDMKIDSGLFFLSVITIYILYKTITGKYSQKSTHILYFIIGILAGFIFTVKFTSLLTIVGIFGVLLYRYLGWGALVGYFALFIGVFTKLDFWSYMNVVYPKDDNDFKSKVLLGSLVIACVGFGWSISRYKHLFKKVLVYVGIISLGIMIGISPWASNNLIRSDGIGVSELLSGETNNFRIDYSNVHDASTLKRIKDKKIAGRGLESSGITSNEDYGRYFGYEKGINNYIKLPWNLTMQINQGGEFTNIGWIFLALLPGLFLFLPIKNRYFGTGIGILLLLELLIFFYKPSSLFFTELFARFNLPGGYAILLAGIVFFLIGVASSLNTEKKYIKLFIYNLIFASIYMFLWMISAFGIVWYGILMYFNMLLVIAICLYYVSCYKHGDSDKKISIKFFGTATIGIILSVWFFNSVFPHSLNNLKNAAYLQFKTGEITTTNAPFLYHKEYLPILFELNIGSENFDDFIDQNINPVFLERTPDIAKYGIINSVHMLNNIRNSKEVDFTFRQQAETSINNIYESILRPSSGLENDGNIYRVGTFLKYFILRNDSRLHEDSLLTQFQDYFYNDDIDITIENLKKGGLTYLLVDLNAATIDNDPAQNLTKRVENMFVIFTSSNIELIETDSVCLKLGLEQYKKENNLKKYLQISTVNHNSASGNKLPKIKLCHDRIYELISNDLVSQQEHSYLLPIKQHILQKNLQSELEIRTLIQQAVNHGYKVLFKIK